MLPDKNYNDAFEFDKVMYKILLDPCFLRVMATTSWLALFNWHCTRYHFFTIGRDYIGKTYCNTPAHYGGRYIGRLHFLD